jgi:hypothetical protein
MTRSVRIAFSLLFLGVALASTSNAQTDAQRAFATIKSMPGMWVGKSSDGRDLEISFKLVSGGSAVMSEIMGSDSHDMVSMFNLDGADKLLMTHYCSIGNQPRMQASVSPDGKTLTFNYVDATSLASADAGHMQKMVLTVVDENHHTEDWTFVDHGKEMKEFFDLHRKL